MILLRILLFPFAWAYDLITSLRNYLYDRGIKPSARFDIPVICVGNLAVGGTGKTPMVEHLIRLLYQNHRVATLSRGYGRKTKGFRLAQPADNASTLGDEPFQFYSKFRDRITVAVGEERALAIPTILQTDDDVEVILLDDAFQHRKVTPSFSILLSDYNRPFYNDYILPAGRLRESKQNAARADAIVVTKCPTRLSDDAMIEIEHSIRRYAEKPIFFTSIRYGGPVPFSTSASAQAKSVILISGIANAKPLEDYVKQNFTMLAHLRFEDHHVYTSSDLEQMKALSTKHPEVSFLTTEKDKVKLDIAQFQSQIHGLSLFYLPIEIDFLKNGREFDEIVLNHIKRVQ
jgi:tetraacyldisaccharide 4'-kinase